MTVLYPAAAAQVRIALIRLSLGWVPLSSQDLFLNDDYPEEEVEGEGCEDQYEYREVTGSGIHDTCKEGRNEKTTSHAAEDKTHPRLTLAGKSNEFRQDFEYTPGTDLIGVYRICNQW